mgnify:CR=1 FL=1
MIENIAKEYIDIKNEMLQYKKENAEVLSQIKKFSKQLKEKKQQLLQSMKESSLEAYDFDGVTFNVKLSQSIKHDTEKLSEIIDDEDKFSEYIESAKQSKHNIVARAVKKRKQKEE